MVNLRELNTVVSTQHSKDITQEDLKKLIRKEVIDSGCKPEPIDENTVLHQPIRFFVVGRLG